ncbi:MAG: hypothetical protein HQL32_05925, partial [Planctomycetes bacterium]|nr:hypothetical protein [Planctomycetota bacterium]
MSIRKWHSKMILCHVINFLLEVCLFGTLTGVILYGYAEFFGFRYAMTLPICLALWLLFSLLRFRNHWNLPRLWQEIDIGSSNEQAGARISRDLLLQKGHLPNAELAELAAVQLSEKPMASYPLSKVLFSAKYEFLFFFLLLLLPLALDRLHFASPQSEPLHITLVPPDYLNLESREVHPFEKRLKVFPGTLLKMSVNDDSPLNKLSDTQGNRYLARQHKGYRHYEIRILKKTELVFSASEEASKKSWNLELLEDKVPEAKWLYATREKYDWKKTLFAYKASDDLSLGDAFITVNGEELEYAGSPEGKKSFSYKWEFDPLDHINLEGGNVHLQVRAYDLDSINGPKFGETEAITWYYPGVKEQTEKALAKLNNLREKAQKRSKQLSDAKGVHEEMKQAMEELHESIMDNPVLPPYATQNMKSMKSRLDYINRLWESGKDPNFMQAKEGNELSSQAQKLNNLESILKSILHTIEAAKFVEKFNELAKKAFSGEKLDWEEMSDLFDKLQEHLSESDMSQQMQKEMLNKLEQAQIASAMGDNQKASESMEELSEMMQENGGSSMGNDALSEKFRELKAMLDELEARQQSNLKITQEKSPEGMSSTLKQHIKTFNKKIIANKAYTAYQNMLKSFREAFINNNSAPASKILDKLNNSKNLESQGQELNSIKNNLTTISEGRHALIQNLPSANSLKEKGSLKGGDLVFYRSLLDSLKSHEQRIKSNQPEDLQEVKVEQSKISDLGHAFSKDFRESFESLINSPSIFRMADQGASYGTNALGSLKHNLFQAQWDMNSAHKIWLRLQQVFQQIENQSQQQQSRNSNSQMKIGKDGKLQFQKKKIMSDNEGE